MSIATDGDASHAMVRMDTEGDGLVQDLDGDDVFNENDNDDDDMEDIE